MAWSVLQSVSVTNAGGTSLTITTAAFGNNLSAGSKLIAYVCGSTSSGITGISSVKDSSSNTFSQVAANTGGLEDAWIYVLDTPAGDVGTKPTISVTFTGTQNGSAILVQEVSGLAAGSTAAAVLDGTAGTASGSSGTSPLTATWGAYTSSRAGEYLVGFYSDDGDNTGGTWSPNPPAGFTGDTNNIISNGNDDLGVFYKNSTGGSESIATLSVSFAGGATLGWATFFVAFKLAAGAPAQMPQRQPFKRRQTLQPPQQAAAVAAATGQVQAWPTIPVPRRRLARAQWGGVKGAGFVAVPAPLQGPYLPPRRRLARAVWAGSRPFTGFAAVPAPRQVPPLPRRKLARALWAGSKPFTGFVFVPAPPQGPYLPPRRVLLRALWRGGPVPFVIPVPNRQPPYMPPRRPPGRAVLGYFREGQVPQFVPVPPPQQLPTYPRRVLLRALVRGTPLSPVNAVPTPEFVTRETPDDKSHWKKLWWFLGD